MYIQKDNFFITIFLKLLNLCVANTARISREEIEEARARGEAPVDRKAQLREMKQGLQKTSISFGHEPVNYVTDNVEKARQCLVGFSVEEKQRQKENAKQMKASLTQTSFKLGDVEPQYMSVNTESMMLTKDAAKFQDKKAEKAAAEALKESIKASSLHFGNERRSKELMQSVAHEGMENILKGNTNDFAKLKQDTVDLTNALRKHNFEFGNTSIPAGLSTQHSESIPFRINSFRINSVQNQFGQLDF